MAVEVKITPENILPWSGMEDWENGAASAPTEHTLSGSGATIAREASTVKVGTYSAAVTRVGNDTTLYYDVPTYTDFKGKKMTFGCWVYATVASRGRIAISDGVGSTNSSYHTGGSGWERLSVTHDVDSSATRIRVEMHVNTGNTTVYFDDGKLFDGGNDQTILTDIADVSEFTPVNRYRGQTLKPARREGSRIPRMYLEEKQVKVSGMVIGSTAINARSSIDTFNSIVQTQKIKFNEDQELKDIYLFDDRLIQGHLSDIKIDMKAVLKVMEFDLKYSCPEPFFRDINKTRSANDISTSPASFTVTNSGNVLARPVITISATGGSITSLTLENLTSGQKLSYSGTISTGTALVIDTVNLTVENDGTGDLANFTGDTDMHLDPGDNEFKFTGTNGDYCKIDWYNRYL